MASMPPGVHETNSMTLGSLASSKNALSLKRPVAAVVSTTYNAVAVVVSVMAPLVSTVKLTTALGRLFAICFGATNGFTLCETCVPELFLTEMSSTQLVPVSSQPAAFQPAVSAQAKHLSCGGGGGALGGSGGGGGGG